MTRLGHRAPLQQQRPAAPGAVGAPHALTRSHLSARARTLHQLSPGSLTAPSPASRPSDPQTPPVTPVLPPTHLLPSLLSLPLPPPETGYSEGSACDQFASKLALVNHGDMLVKVYSHLLMKVAGFGWNSCFMGL